MCLKILPWGHKNWTPWETYADVSRGQFYSERFCKGCGKREELLGSVPAREHSVETAATWEEIKCIPADDHSQLVPISQGWQEEHELALEMNNKMVDNDNGN